MPLTKYGELALKPSAGLPSLKVQEILQTVYSDSDRTIPIEAIYDDLTPMPSAINALSTYAEQGGYFMVIDDGSVPFDRDNKFSELNLAGLTISAGPSFETVIDEENKTISRLYTYVAKNTSDSPVTVGGLSIANIAKYSNSSFSSKKITFGNGSLYTMFYHPSGIYWSTLLVREVFDTPAIVQPTETYTFTLKLTSNFNPDTAT